MSGELPPARELRYIDQLDIDQLKERFLNLSLGTQLRAGLMLKFDEISRTASSPSEILEALKTYALKNLDSNQTGENLMHGMRRRIIAFCDELQKPVTGTRVALPTALQALREDTAYSVFRNVTSLLRRRHGK